MLSSSLTPRVLSFPPNSSSAHPPRRTSFRRTAVVNTATAYRERSSPSIYLNPSGMASCSSLYEILGIPMAASNQEIKSAYRRLARTCHPDVAALERKDSSGDEFMKIHAAYSTLSDPDKRAVYDRKLFRRNQPLTAGFSSYRGRSWETDQCW